MQRWWTILALSLELAATACGGNNGSSDAEDADAIDDGSGETEPDAEDADDAEAEADAPDPNAPIVPEVGTSTTAPLDCTGAYVLPAELTGADGLGHYSWTLDDLRFSMAWDVPTRFDTTWISDQEGANPSLRTHPWLVPEAGRCYQREVEAATAVADPFLPGLLSAITAFSHPDVPYSGLAADRYAPPAYDLSGEHVLVRALRGLLELPNELTDAPAAPVWDETLRDTLVAAVADYPAAVEEPLARLVLAIGEAYLLKQEALATGGVDAFESIWQMFLWDNYASLEDTYVSPSVTNFVSEVLASGDQFDLGRIYAAALAVVTAAENARVALAGVTPFDSPGINLLTAHGRILIDTSAADTTWTAEQLADTALVIDLGGDDTYQGRFAATHAFWMSAAVLIDVAGNDRYTPETADIESSATRSRDAFAMDKSFTQGTGVFGVGVLIDAAGNDTYAAGAYAQGSGAFGVGVLYDADGTDSYKLGTAGQGSGYFGIGLQVDGGSGDDRYGVYTVGQGVGRPKGHGLLLDLGGNDTYIGYYAGRDPEFPEPGYPNFFGMAAGSGYSAPDGTPHYMSVAQGVGWGFRHEWVASPEVAWSGGFGALLDFGTGTDQHYADCMTMGQGFVYGFGFLYDGGGDDRYRTFWWGPAASAHMGTSLMIEEDGNDDIHVTALSGGYGYDCSVGWVIDEGGDDTYGGQFNYGRAYNYGLTFFINNGGDDTYNADLAQADPPFGIVDTGFAGTKLIGAFLDLGGGNDTYNTTRPGVGNDANWYLEPVGTGIDPALHIGIGIDR
jgi:hypothetical protein